MMRAWLGWSLPSYIDTVKVRVLLVAVLVFVAGGFIIKTNELSTTGFHVHDLERQVAALQSDADKLQIEIASLQSMPNISRRLQGMNMIAPESVEYIHNGSVAVANK